MPRRREDWIGITIALTTLVVMGVGLLTHLRAQSILSLPQVAINAVMGEQISTLTHRIDKIEGLVQYALIGIVGNLLTLIFILFQQGKKRAK